MIKTKLYFIIISGIIVSLFGGCKKKDKSVDSLFNSKDSVGLTTILENPDSGVDDLVGSCIALVKLERSNIMVKTMGKLSSKNQKVCREVLGKAVVKLTTMLSSKTDGVKAKDALITLTDLMDGELKTRSAKAVLVWFAEDMEKRVDAGDYEYKKAIEAFWQLIDKSTAKKVAAAHAKWMMSDFKSRGVEGKVIFKRAGIFKNKNKFTVLNKIY